MINMGGRQALGNSLLSLNPRYWTFVEIQSSSRTLIKEDYEPIAHSIFLISDPIRIRRDHFVQLSYV
jgi:hypothetical protein